MSLIPRLLRAAVATLFGAMMIAIAPSTGGAPFFYAFGAFCLSIGVVCISRGRAAQFFGSVIASGVLLAGTWYSTSTLMSGELISGGRSQPSFLNSLGFLTVFGIPAAAYLWSARFGLVNALTKDKENGDA